MQELLSILIPILASMLTGIAGWAVGKRKLKAEAEKSELDNVEQSLSIYRKVVEDLGITVQKYKDDLTAMETTVASLKQQIAGMVRQLDEKDTVIYQLQKKLNNGK